MEDHDGQYSTAPTEVSRTYTTEDKARVEDPQTLAGLEKALADKDAPLAFDLPHPTEGYVKFAHGTVITTGETSAIEFVVREMDQAGFERDQSAELDHSPRPKDYMGDLGTVEAIKLENGDWWVGGTVDQYSPRAQEKTGRELRAEGEALVKEVLGSLNSSHQKEES